MDVLLIVEDGESVVAPLSERAREVFPAEPSVVDDEGLTAIAGECEARGFSFVRQNESGPFELIAGPDWRVGRVFPDHLIDAMLDGDEVEPLQVGG